MSWLLDLYETYENNNEQIGVMNKKGENEEYMLLPVAHSTQAAQIEVTVDTEGKFYSAKVVEKKQATTVIPCTEASFSRTSGAVPHPLHDKLMYVAGDFERYGGVIKKGSSPPFNDYMEQLKDWCDSPYAHPKVIAIYHYLRKGTLIKDLIAKSILYVDENDQLIKKWTKKEEEQFGDKPKIFQVMSDTQDKVFVRFDVHEVGQLNTEVWNDQSIYDSFIAYYKEKLKENDLCYVTGEFAPKTDRHASKIRHAADLSKLIAINSSAFKGRFTTAKDVVNIGFNVSQKAHNALKWLIIKQGQMVDGRVFLVWGNESVDIPSPQDDLQELFTELGILNDPLSNGVDQDQTHEVFARAVNKAIAGYKSDLTYKSKVMILILDAATTGRLSVMYYRSINTSDYFDRLANWSKTCSWLHAYKRNEDKKIMQFYGPPIPRDIALAAYGSHANDKVIKGLMERMMPCIVDGQRIPLDVIRSAVIRASNPVSMEEWEWGKTLSITCALLKKQKHYEGEEYDVPLDTNCKKRDYLFGRLLAIADVLEKNALSVADEKRATNAIRYMNAFSRHPVRTWEVIQAALQPYQAKLGNQVLYYNRLIDEVANQINLEDFNDKPLSGVYLLGFYSQRHELYRSKKDRENEQVEHTN